MLEITKISSKGQIVIPVKMRESLELVEGSSIAITIQDNIMMIKKVDTEQLQEEFKKLTREGEHIAKKNNLKTEEEIMERIHRGRKVHESRT
ncbi:MAG TPA: AbrB/MazE/SpoVT family DNA-binding domain-containing protein [Candidatus Nanoarchaeia archaeon]|nr:AbrB/MazE/SpoVT family DNA-binding domain-containing protein [Candidatus Nanoarchaeia archaeon]